VGSYEVKLTHSAEKELVNLPKAVVPGVWRKLRALADEPRPRHAKKLRGAEKAYRLRVKAYRVIYTIDDERKLVRVSIIRHRKEAYR